MITSITMLFGPGMPMLFPLGLLAFIILYCCERLAIAKYYRLPPNIDDSLNYDCIQDILWTPIFYAGMGFWLFTNRQIFANDVIPIQYLHDVQRMNHEIFPSIMTLSPGTPLLYLMVIYIMF